MIKELRAEIEKIESENEKLVEENTKLRHAKKMMDKADWFWTIKIITTEFWVSNSQLSTSTKTIISFHYNLSYIFCKQQYFHFNVIHFSSYGAELFEVSWFSLQRSSTLT